MWVIHISDIVKSLYPQEVTNKTSYCLNIIISFLNSYAACLGSYGINCSSSCPTGFYGHGCSQICNCYYNEECNAKKGCLLRNNKSTAVNEKQNGILIVI